MNPELSCFIANGEAEDASASFHPEQNRSFMFGDGVFETMRMVKGRLSYAAFHYDRLIRSMNALGIEIKGLPPPEDLEKLIVSRISPPLARVKLVAFRQSTGAYVPESNSAGYYLQVVALDGRPSLAEKGLTVGLYQEQRKSAGALSWMKSTSSQLYVMAGLHAKKQGWDDCILLNDNNQLMEGSSSNLFAFLDGIWVTPPVSSGCIEGVFRRVVIEAMKKTGIRFSEQAISLNDAWNADELILTNAVSGIRWIERFNEKTYRHKEAQNLFEAVKTWS